MQLAFIWTEDFGCISKQRFNFDGNFEFLYNSDSKVLSIKENENYIILGCGLFSYAVPGAFIDRSAMPCQGRQFYLQSTNLHYQQFAESTFVLQHYRLI
ncbi:hypothetical protein [Bacillus cereus]|uniref:hypothetical protein n=1 Tax=Bacillus cereus TaxID=1396 RepID=UPI001CD5383E|nr:hypothetical protein [Bacillus cereus]